MSTFTVLATDFLGQVCSLGTHDNADDVLVQIEEMLAMVDHVVFSGQSHQLQSLRTRLVHLYEHWTLIQSNLPTCTSLATGVEGGRVPHRIAGQCGRPKIFININMVEFLRSVGYRWSEVAHVLLIGRSTLWRRLKEVGVTLERYSNISDEESVRILQPNVAKLCCRACSLLKGSICKGAVLGKVY